MKATQLIWPQGDAWVGQRGETLAYRIGATCATAPPGAVQPVLAPRAAGGPVLWLDAQGTLAGSGPTAPMTGLAALAADPWLLVAVHFGGILRLVSDRVCTSLALPAVPAIMAALGSPQGGPILSLLDLPDGVHALSWQDDRVSVQRLTEARARELLLLAGDPPLAAVRHQGGVADRLLLFWHRQAPWTVWQPLPPLLLPTEALTRLRQTDAGPCVRVGTGAWLLYRDGSWRHVALAEQDGVPTLRHGSYASWDIEPWLEKEHIPPAGKLAVGRHRQGNHEPIAQEKSSQRDGAFVRNPSGD